MWVSPLNEMLVINEAFILLGMPGRSIQMDPQIFPPKMIHNFRFLMFPRFRRLYLTNLVELSSWRFFGGSIDSFKYSCNFQQEFV
jgi:hypothetical protein